LSLDRAVAEMIFCRWFTELYLEN